jgi:hypothetical protein
VEREDSVVPEGTRHAIVVERCCRERARVDPVSNEPDAALEFQTVEQVQDRTAVCVLPI